MRAECVGYRLDYSNYMTSVMLIASSNSTSAPSALVGNYSMWTASPADVDADGDFVYSVMLSSSEKSYLASLRVDVANVAVVMLYVQCRQRPGRWSVATSPVLCTCNITQKVKGERSGE